MILRTNRNSKKDNEEKYIRCRCEYECPIHKKMVEEANNYKALQQEAEKGDSQALQCPRESPPPAHVNKEASEWEIDRLPNKIIPIITFHQVEQTLSISVIVVGLVLILLFIVNEFRWHRVTKALRRLEEKLKDNSK